PASLLLVEGRNGLNTGGQEFSRRNRAGSLGRFTITRCVPVYISMAYHRLFNLHVVKKQRFIV
ncbi:hypothetical protein, partial [Salmonella enterica]|uniref:hypothetical protein n=1 Tax=Salmonella enterica TaxID=28901 RepID=UPI00398C3F60